MQDHEACHRALHHRGAPRRSTGMAVSGLRSVAQIGGGGRGQYHELGAMGDTPEAIVVTGDLHFVAGYGDACTYMDAGISADRLVFE